ncbi:MAG: MarR family winged helix-turn-helix transcriptional regulator [Candidatus Moraniibacteriota bacterium]
METLSSSVRFFIDMAKVAAVVNRRFDNGLGGLGFTEFIILSHLSEAGSAGIRRIDLAEKVGLTASGITRLLLPMEKIGLVKKEVNKDDARSSLVMIASGGKRKLEEGIERAELLADEIIPFGKKREMRELSLVLTGLGKAIR